MIDIAILRANPEAVKENMMKKHHANIDEDIITEFLNCQ